MQVNLYVIVTFLAAVMFIFISAIRLISPKVETIGGVIAGILVGLLGGGFLFLSYYLATQPPPH